MTRIFLQQSDDLLLAECQRHTFKSSGPGGQHRDKTDSAVRLTHLPTGISAKSSDSRSQSKNRETALRRLKMNIAIQLRQEPPDEDELEDLLTSLLSSEYRQNKRSVSKILKINKKNPLFWYMASILLDLLHSNGGKLSETAQKVRISTSNLTSFLKSERHLHAAANSIRKQNDQRPIH